MSNKVQFFIYLIEKYAENQNTTADKVMEQWDSINIVDYIYNMYEMYHSEAIENAFDDINRVINEHEVVRR